MADEDETEIQERKRMTGLPWWIWGDCCCKWALVVGGVIWLIILTLNTNDNESKISRLVKTCCAGSAAIASKGGGSGRHRKSKHEIVVETDPEIEQAIAIGNADIENQAVIEESEKPKSPTTPPPRWSRAGAVKKASPQQAKQVAAAAPRTKAIKKK
jgi:hypothetical protein